MDLILRGSIHWDQQEYRRRSIGCQCLSFGIIPTGRAHGEPREKTMAGDRSRGVNPAESVRVHLERTVSYFERQS